MWTCICILQKKEEEEQEGENRGGAFVVVRRPSKNMPPFREFESWVSVYFGKYIICIY